MAINIYDVGMSILAGVPKEEFECIKREQTGAILNCDSVSYFHTILHYLTIRDLCRLELTSKSLFFAVRHGSYDVFARSLTGFLLENHGEADQTSADTAEGGVRKIDPKQWPFFPRWQSVWGVRFHLATLAAAKIYVSEQQILTEYTLMEEELKYVRSLCEFLNEHKCSESFSDPKTISLFHDVLASASQQDMTAFQAHERAAIAHLYYGLNELRKSASHAEHGLHPPSHASPAAPGGGESSAPATKVNRDYSAIKEIEQTHFSSSSPVAWSATITADLTNPSLDQNRFFHALLTEFGKLVHGIKRLQKSALKCERELIILRHQVVKAIAALKKSLQKIAASHALSVNLADRSSSPYCQDLIVVDSVLNLCSEPSGDPFFHFLQFDSNKLKAAYKHASKKGVASPEPGESHVPSNQTPFPRGQSGKSHNNDDSGHNSVNSSPHVTSSTIPVAGTPLPELNWQPNNTHPESLRMFPVHSTPENPQYQKPMIATFNSGRDCTPSMHFQHQDHRQEFEHLPTKVPRSAQYQTNGINPLILKGSYADPNNDFHPYRIPLAQSH